jgi:hypothetical protein
MQLNLIPKQPALVVEAVSALLQAPVSAPDPWWQAGLDDALETSPYGATTARPRSTRGAARA